MRWIRPTYCKRYICDEGMRDLRTFTQRWREMGRGCERAKERDRREMRGKFSSSFSLSALSISDDFSYWASETVTNQKTEKLWSAPGPDVARIRVSQGELWVGRLLRGFGRGQSHAECFARSQRETSGKKPVLTPSAAPLSETEITKWWRDGGSFYTNLGHRQCTLLLIFQIIKGYIPVF